MATITIVQDLLKGDHGPSGICWSGTVSTPLTTGSPAMVTPMGTSLATWMPKLTDVYLYTPFGGDEDWYCTWVPNELCKLLCHGKLKRLHYVFVGETVVRELQTISNSRKCFDRISNIPESARRKLSLCCIIRSRSIAEQQRQRVLRWLDDRDRCMKAYRGLFAWKWGDGDVSMSSSGCVQAVVTTWMK